MKINLMIILFACFGICAQAQDSGESAQHFNLDEQLAIQGYDPVAYFTAGKAQKGKKNITASHSGVTYRFASEEHKALFEADPAKYEPAYGGWCAYAMGYDGSKVKIDPKTFKIIDGELYLFYNFYFNNTLKSWNKDEQSLHNSADNNWAEILKKN